LPVHWLRRFIHKPSLPSADWHAPCDVHRAIVLDCGFAAGGRGFVEPQMPTGMGGGLAIAARIQPGFATEGSVQ